MKKSFSREDPDWNQHLPFWAKAWPASGSIFYGNFETAC
jgi:hypothetical protein